MKIDFDQAITDLDGTPIRIPSSMEVDKTTGQLPMDTMSLKRVCTTALTQALDGDDKENTADAMLERDMLARRIHVGGEQDVSVKEAALLQDRVFKRWKVVPLLASGALAILNASQ